MIQHILDLGDIAFLCQQTATSRRRVFINSQLCSQPYLVLTPPSLDTWQGIPVYPAFPLRDGKLQITGRQRTQQQPFQAAVPLDHPQCILTLAHRTLSNHLAGNYKVSSQFLHQGTGAAQHKGLAINAWVQGTAVSMARMTQHLQKILPQRHCTERNLIAGSIAGCHRLTIQHRRAAKKRRSKIKRQNVNSLLLHHLYCQY